MNGKKSCSNQTVSEKHSQHLYLLLNKFSAPVAFNFIERLQQRVELIIQNPEIGKPSQKTKNIRSLILHPHNKSITG